MLNRPNLTGTLITSLVAIALAALVLLFTVPSLLIALVRPGAAKEDPSQLIASHVDEHTEAMTRYEERFNGRYLFFKPPPPPPPARPDPPPRRDPPSKPDPDPVEVDPGPPPAPSTYQGPPISAILGDIVWFQNRDSEQPMMIIQVGEEKNGVRVISTDPPRSTRLAHQGGEYDVPLFPTYQWSMPFFVNQSGGSRSVVPGLIEVADPPPGEDGKPVEPEPAAMSDLPGRLPDSAGGLSGVDDAASRAEMIRQAEEDGRDLEAEQEEEAAAAAAREARREASRAEPAPREP